MSYEGTGQKKQNKNGMACKYCIKTMYTQYDLHAYFV